MRAPRIPTESFGLSIGAGALIAFVMVLAPGMSEGFVIKTILFSPLVCGCVASLTFGAVDQPGIRHSLMTGVAAFIAFYSLVWISVIFLGLRPSRELGMAMYVTAIPPLFIAPITVSAIGSVFGWMSALALRR